MRCLLLIAAITLLFPALAASADSLSGDVGVGFHFSTGSTAFLLRYQHDARPLSIFSTYYEASYAFWNGPDHANAVGVAWGIQWARTTYDYLTLAVGLSHISRTTPNLGQPFEFYGRAAYGINVGKALFSIGWTHYSDAKFLFGWSGPNNAENFATLSLGIRF